LPPSQAERFVFERIFSPIVNRSLAEKYYRITMPGGAPRFGQTQSGMRKSGNRFSARIPLQLKGIDHVDDFGSNRSEVIVI
jgi:hypothetical protein